MIVAPALAVRRVLNVFAPPIVCAVVERRPGLVASASERVRTFDEIEPPFALLPVGVVKLVTMLEPLASFERAIAAAALMSALTISPSRIFAEVTAHVVRSPATRELVRASLV